MARAHRAWRGFLQKRFEIRQNTGYVIVGDLLNSRLSTLVSLGRHCGISLTWLLFPNRGTAELLSTFNGINIRTLIEFSPMVAQRNDPALQLHDDQKDDHQSTLRSSQSLLEKIPTSTDFGSKIRRKRRSQFVGSSDLHSTNNLSCPPDQVHV